MASGMDHAFRATPTHTQATGTTCERSRTDDLRGVRYVLGELR